MASYGLILLMKIGVLDIQGSVEEHVTALKKLFVERKKEWLCGERVPGQFCWQKKLSDKKKNSLLII